MYLGMYNVYMYCEVLLYISFGKNVSLSYTSMVKYLQS